MVATCLASQNWPVTSYSVWVTALSAAFVSKLFIAIHICEIFSLTLAVCMCIQMTNRHRITCLLWANLAGKNLRWTKANISRDAKCEKKHWQILMVQAKGLMCHESEGVQSYSMQKALAELRLQNCCKRGKRSGNISLRKALKYIVLSSAIVECKGKRYFSFAGLLLNVAFQCLFISSLFSSEMECIS